MVCNTKTILCVITTMAGGYFIGIGGYTLIDRKSSFSISIAIRLGVCTIESSKSGCGGGFIAFATPRPCRTRDVDRG